MSIDLARLEQLAAEATPGSWRATQAHLHCRDWWQVGPGLKVIADTRTEPDARLIAACDPATVTALVRAVKAARALLDNLDEEIAGENLEAWDAPYRIAAPSFRGTADALREALAPFRGGGQETG